MKERQVEYWKKIKRIPVIKALLNVFPWEANNIPTTITLMAILCFQFWNKNDLIHFSKTCNTIKLRKKKAKTEKIL
jgi:hypothetical protein